VVNSSDGQSDEDDDRENSEEEDRSSLAEIIESQSENFAPESNEKMLQKFQEDNSPSIDAKTQA